MNRTNNHYFLGVNEQELERLRFQHSVWGPVTNRFFDRLNVQRGWKCLDVGAGPGFVSVDLRERVGDRGEVTALEPSQMYLEYFKEESARRGWKNIRFVQSAAEEATLPESYYDLLFARWVISFTANPERFLLPLLRSLKPGGIVAFQDYYYEGLSLYPNTGAFSRMHDVVIAHYRSGGGDPYVTGKLPAIFRKHKLSLVDYLPNCLAGGPGSPIMEWGYRFFSVHTQAMIDGGHVSQQEGHAIVADFEAHLKDPDSLFFSPLVVDVAARREG